MDLDSTYRYALLFDYICNYFNGLGAVFCNGREVYKPLGSAGFGAGSRYDSVRFYMVSYEGDECGNPQESRGFPRYC
jgi:hypothetical protein